MFFVAEVLLVTPLLFGFKRYAWRWLNGWIACIYGFLCGAIPCLILGTANFWSGRLLGATPVREFWIETIGSAFLWGVPGLVGALVFRLIAVRSA
jgi:hypothetical protein